MTIDEDTEPSHPSPDEVRAAAAAHAAAEEALANEAPPLLSGPKRQHFLPRFYLDGFARDGFVAVFDREKDEIRRQQPINTAVIGHFYTMEDDEGRRRFEIEALLADYEGKAKPVIDKMVAASEITLEERADLSVFIALAATRTPDMVNSVQAINGEIVKHMAKQMFANVDRVFDRLRRDERRAADSDAALRDEAEMMVRFVASDDYDIETDQKWAMSRAIDMALTIAPYLDARHWRVVHRANDKMSFITSDAPVYLNSVVPGPSVYGVGFGSPDAFISFPLHQSCALEMFADTGQLEHKVAPREYVRMANIHYAKRCQRFVVGRDEALLKSLTVELGLANTKWKPKFRVN